jgi:hypothetical protein
LSLPVIRACRPQQPDAGARRLTQPSPKPSRDGQRLVVEAEVSLLEPSHENPREPCRTAIRITLAGHYVPSVGEVRRIGFGQQFDERIETDGVDDLQHVRSLAVTHADEPYVRKEPTGNLSNI